MRIPIFFLLICWCLIYFSSCKEDQHEGIEDIFFLLQADNGVSLNYSIKTSKFTRLSNPQDSSLLTLSEKTLLLPEISKAMVKFELDTLGNFAGEIVMIPTESIYPENVIGRRVTPEYLEVARMEFSQSGITYYNVQNEIIQADPFCQRLSNYYINLASQLSEEVLISPEEFDLVMEAWEDAGFEVVDNGVDYSRIKFDLPGGNYSYVLIDRNLQSIVGTAHYMSDGSLISKSMNYIQSGTEHSAQKIHNLYVTPFQTPFSEIDLKIVIQSEITELNYTSNL